MKDSLSIKIDSFKKLPLLELGLDLNNFGRIFAFVDFGNVQHWYDEQRKKKDGTLLQPDEVFYVDIIKLGKFLDLFVEHKRFYYGHIPSKSATLHIIILAEKCKFVKITKPVHRVRHYLTPYDKISRKVTIYKDASGKDYILIPKCNFDVEITLDAIRRINDYDTFLLCSSDRDFEKLLYFLKKKGEKTILIGGGYVSKDLKQHADKFIHANRIRNLITSVKKVKARSLKRAGGISDPPPADRVA